VLLFDGKQRSLVDLFEIFFYGDIKSYNLLLPIRGSIDCEDKDMVPLTS